MALNIFKHSRIQTVQLLKDTISYCTDKFKQSNQVFTVSSAYGQIIFVLENIAELLFYYIEDSVTEMSIREASRRNSVYSIAAMAGYKPSRCVAASGQISISRKPSYDTEIVGNIITIPNYLKIKCTNTGLFYILELPSDSMRIDMTSTDKIYINILQGSVETQNLQNATGKKFQSYSMPYDKNFFIDNKWVKVFVNDVYQPVYESMFQIPKGEPGCMIRTGINSGIDIFFGNGNYGSNPEVGADIRVEYLLTEGMSGNLNTNNATDINWEFEETGFDEALNEINLNDLFDISTTIVPNFGSNPEPLSITRQMLSKTNDRLMVEDDYTLLFKRMQAFSIVRVGRDTTNGRIFNAMLIPDITKRTSKGISYFDLEEDEFTLSAKKKNEILKYIRRMGTEVVSTEINFIDPVIKRYIMNVSIVMFSGYDENVVKNSIVSAISSYFILCDRKDRIPRSDIVAVIEDVDGVDSVNVVFVSQENEEKHYSNPQDTKLYGLDDMNDIIIDKGDLVIIRGGWQDRYGNFYQKSYRSDQVPCAINITVKDINKGY